MKAKQHARKEHFLESTCRFRTVKLKQHVMFLYKQNLSLTRKVSGAQLSCEERSQLLDFFLILTEQSVLRVLVDARPVLNALGPVCVAQRAQALLVVVVCRGETGDHQGARVPSQRVLQQPGQLGVSVGDVFGASIYQGGDDVAQGREGEVDLCGLAESLASSTSFRLTLTSCQVHKVEFPCPQMVPARCV